MNRLTVRFGAPVIVVSAIVASMSTAGGAAAHVHSVTPLNQCSVDDAEHSGGRIILNTPATVGNGGPIQGGPIPLNTGNAAFDPVTGGGNHGEPHCP